MRCGRKSGGVVFVLRWVKDGSYNDLALFVCLIHMGAQEALPCRTMDPRRSEN